MTRAPRQRIKIENAQIDAYSAILKEYSRPPSQGGNTSAYHQHRLLIAGDTYTFLARGAKKWVYKGDKVSFEWGWDETGSYRNIIPETLYTVDRGGKIVRRGDRRRKRQWRSVPARPPK